MRWLLRLWSRPQPVGVCFALPEHLSLMQAWHCAASFAMISRTRFYVLKYSGLFWLIDQEFRDAYPTHLGEIDESWTSDNLQETQL